MDDFKKAVLDRISWAKEDIEKSISKQDVILFNMELGKIQAYYGLAQKFDFMDEDSLVALIEYKRDCIDRYYQFEATEKK